MKAVKWCEKRNIFSYLATFGILRIHIECNIYIYIFHESDKIKIEIWTLVNRFEPCLKGGVLA